MRVLPRLLRSALRGATTRLMDRVGGRLVASFADTSSDAPDAYYAPKRDAYAAMVREEQGAQQDPPSE